MFAFSPRARLQAPGRLTAVHGDWHLWIYCSAWAISHQGRPLAHWEASRTRIERALAYLDGQALAQLVVQPAGARTTSMFDLGGTLVTWPYDEDDEQWMLYEPSVHVLTVRTDGRYSRVPGDTAPEQEDWQPSHSEECQVRSSNQSGAARKRGKPEATCVPRPAA